MRLKKRGIQFKTTSYHDKQTKRDRLELATIIGLLILTIVYFFIFK